jgi:ribosome-binding factor A
MRYEVKNRRMGTVHIVRWVEVHMDGVHIDTYDHEDRAMAHAYVKYMNTRPANCSIPAARLTAS